MVVDDDAGAADGQRAHRTRLEPGRGGPRHARVSVELPSDLSLLRGWVALLVGCVEYDTGKWQAAETTRSARRSTGAKRGENTGRQRRTVI